MKALQPGSSVFCLCVFAAAAAAAAAASAAAAAADTQSLPEEDGVLQLTTEDFSTALIKYQQLLVHFYTPLYQEGLRVKAAFEGAASELQGSEVKFAVVDVTKEKDLAKELNATSSAGIRLYLDGDKYNPVPCPVPQNSASIVTWLKRRAGSAADLITDLGQLETSEEVTVVGFFKELDHDYVQVFYSAAIDLPDMKFAVTQNSEVIRKYGQTHDVVLLLKKSKTIQVHKITPLTSKEDLIVFITVFSMEPVTEYTGKTASQILSSPVLNHLLLFIRKSSADFQEIYSAFTNAALAFRLKILFVLVNVDESRNGRLMEYFRVKDFEAPLVRMINMTDQVTFQLPSDYPDEETVKQFCQSYLDGKAKPKMRSEPIPERWDEKPVKELVGLTLEKVGFNPNKTVFVLFYVPYSQRSQALFPLWEDLAKALKHREDVIIARFDASANDINMSMQGPYPTLYLFPALCSERMVFYTGERKLKDLLVFLDEEMEKAKKYRVVEDEERKKYMDALNAEKAKRANKQSKDEF